MNRARDPNHFTTLFAESQRLRENPLHRLSFAWINDRASHVLRLPKLDNPRTQHEIGRQLGEELGRAVGEAIADGFEVSVVAMPLIQIATADVPVRFLRSFMAGFGMALQEGLGAEYRNSRAFRAALVAADQIKADERANPGMKGGWSRRKAVQDELLSRMSA